MICDVSEIKAFRHCKRKWQLSSRNQMHLTAKVPPKAFALGTAFHESLHKLYLGQDLDRVHKYIKSCDVSSDDKLLLTSMVNGYEREVLPVDLNEFDVLDIEYHFCLKPIEVLKQYFNLTDEQIIEIIGLDAYNALLDVEMCGSIDMIALRLEDNTIWGFEHKTAKSFRKEVYSWMDEQPRVYTVALMDYVNKYNLKAQHDWEAVGCPDNYTVEKVSLGGVFINEVRKLIKVFESKRTALVYPLDDLRNFILSFCMSMAECHKMVNNPMMLRVPTPDYMSCMNCMYNQVCAALQYQTITLESVLVACEGEYTVRTNDHLEDKEEVNNEVQ